MTTAPAIFLDLVWPKFKASSFSLLISLTIKLFFVSHKSDGMGLVGAVAGAGGIGWSQSTVVPHLFSDLDLDDVQR